MKKLSLIVLLVFAIAAGFAQTSFTAVYSFTGDTGNVTSLNYNGTQPPGITMGAIVKNNLSTSRSGGNFRATTWPDSTKTDYGPIDLTKYIGFTMEANSGYVFTVTSINFGIGKSKTGTRCTQWRGNFDNFGSPFTNYSLNSDKLSNNAGILENPAGVSFSCTGNVLTLGTGYQNITSCDLRMYMYHANASGGTAGLQGDLTITGTYQLTGGSTDPTITISGTPLNDFTYIVGNGPSTAQSFSVGGSNLTGDITVSAPTNFEVCLTENGTYSGSLTLTPTSGTVQSTAIHARLVSGLGIGNYSGNVQCTSPGATTQNVGLSGSVNPVPSPTITVSETSLSGFTYVVDNGPSTAQTFTVSGSNLTADITVTAPTNFEVSTGSNPYSTSLTLTQQGGTVATTTVNVRLAANLTAGNYSGSLQCTSTGATAQNISLSGSVTSPPPTAGRYIVDFEGDGEYKGTYATGTRSLNGINWDLTEVMVSGQDSDWFLDTRAARLRGKNASANMTMLANKLNGAGTITFKYRRYGTDNPQTSWVVEYSTDGGATWLPAGTNNSHKFTALDSDAVQTFTYELNTTDNIRLQIRKEGTDTSSKDRRLNIDNIIITDYPPMFDFYNYVPKQVVNDNITITGGDANYNANATPGPIPNAQNFTASFHNCLTLLGSGPWTIDLKNTNQDPNQVANWAAYKQGGNWYSTALTDGVGSLTITAAKNQDIELLIGKGNDPTLPVTLSHFSATMTAENYVQLTWISQTETNLMGYNVYRSNSDNLSSATQICPMIEGTNTSQAQTYVYVDKDLVEDGTYYYWLQNVDLDGSNAFHGPVSVVFSITGNGGTPPIPTATQLDNAYPNPFNPNTTIRYQLEGAGKVKIEIYNTRGQLVRSFEKGHDAAGHYGIVWDGRDSSGRELPSGVYLYKMSCGKYSSSKKMVLKK